jgi:hypothetical protein
LGCCIPSCITPWWCKSIICWLSHSSTHSLHIKHLKNELVFYTLFVIKTNNGKTSVLFSNSVIKQSNWNQRETVHGDI